MDQPFAAPAGYIWTGTVFARLNPIAGDSQNVLTESQAAYVFGASNPSQYLPAGYGAPAPAPTPAYGMDANGNIGPVTDPAYQYSVAQAQQSAAMWAAQNEAALAARTMARLSSRRTSSQAPM